MRIIYIICIYVCIGYGIAHGVSTEESVNIMAKNAYSFIINTLKVPSSSIIILGRSIGTGPACYLASECCKNDTPPLALILHSPYSSIRDLTTDLIGIFSNCILNRYENYYNLRLINCPVLFIHADNDNVIDIQHSQQMYEMRKHLQFISEIYIQKSNVYMNKDHNVFDYELDVVEPIYEFLQKYSNNTHNFNNKPVNYTLSNATIVMISQTPLEYQKHVQYKKDFSHTCLWCLCPVIFSMECCLGSIYSSVVQPVVHVIKKPDYTYSSRMQRGLPRFAIEFHRDSTTISSTKKIGMKKQVSDVDSSMHTVEVTITTTASTSSSSTASVAKRNFNNVRNPLVQYQVDDLE